MKKYRLNKRGKIQLIIVLLLIAVMCLFHVNKVCAESRIGTAVYAYKDENNNFIYVESENIEESSEAIIECEVTNEDALDIEEFIIELNQEEVDVLTNVLFGEARGIKDKSHQAAVLWCILNRVDNNRFPNTIYEVVSAPNQFLGYKPNRTYSKQELPVLENCRKLAEDVLYRYYKEKAGFENVGRTLPSDYYFFYGKNGENHFTKEWRKYNTLWNWSLESPYEEN